MCTISISPNEIAPNKFLENVSGEYCDILTQFYRTYLKDEDNTDNAAENLFKLIGWEQCSDAENLIEKFYSTEEYQKAITDIQPIMERIIDNMIERDPEEDIFYRDIWMSISRSVLFPDEISIVAAIYCFIQSPKIPYFRLGPGMQMSDEEYREITVELLPELKKSIFAFNKKYSQKTERFSQIVRILNGLHDERKQTVLLSNIVTIFEQNLIQKFSPETDEQDAS